MSDEKRIRVSVFGDASGLDKEIKRVSSDAKEALKGIGLEEILEAADSKFDSIHDRINAINDALSKKRDEANSNFDDRIGKMSNEYGRRKVEKEREDYNKREGEAWEKWKKLADLLEKRIKDGKLSETGQPTPPGEEDDEEGGKKRSSLWQRILRRGSVKGGAQEAVGGQGGLLSSMGMSAGTAAAFMGIAGLISGAVAISFKKGLEDYRLENQIIAKTNIGHNLFGEKFDIENLGMSQTDFKRFARDQMRTFLPYNQNPSETENELGRRVSMMAGYGLNEGDVSSFDKFRQADVRQQENTKLIADILARSENSGLLGVSGDNFTLLPQKIEQVANLLDTQKRNNELIDSNTAINMMMAGTRIGGRFGDDRASEAFGRIDESIKNPRSPGMKAFTFDALQRSNPNASYTDILAQMEGGATKENLQAILPAFANVQQGEYRRMLAYQLTGNWQDARRLDQTNGFETILKSMKSEPITDDQAEKRFGMARARGEELTDSLKVATKEIVSAVTHAGNNMVEAVDKLGKGQTPFLMGNGAGGMMVPAWYNPKNTVIKPTNK